MAASTVPRASDLPSRLAIAGLHRLLGRTLKADEGGVTHMALTQLGAGYNLWTASMALLLLGSYWLRKRARIAGPR
jgi:hypothetical protein